MEKNVWFKNSSLQRFDLLIILFFGEFQSFLLVQIIKNKIKKKMIASTENDFVIEEAEDDSTPNKDKKKKRKYKKRQAKPSTSSTNEIKRKYPYDIIKKGETNRDKKKKDLEVADKTVIPVQYMPEIVNKILDTIPEEIKVTQPLKYLQKKNERRVKGGIFLYQL